MFYDYVKTILDEKKKKKKKRFFIKMILLGYFETKEGRN